MISDEKRQVKIRTGNGETIDAEVIVRTETHASGRQDCTVIVPPITAAIKYRSQDNG